jgi:hypothetical protein
MRSAAAAPGVAAATSMPTFISRVSRGRQRGRKNNDGNSEFECRHNFPPVCSDFCSANTPVARIAVMLMIVADKNQVALMHINYGGHRTFILIV